MNLRRAHFFLRRAPLFAAREPFAARLLSAARAHLWRAPLFSARALFCGARPFLRPRPPSGAARPLLRRTPLFVARTSFFFYDARPPFCGARPLLRRAPLFRRAPVCGARTPCSSQRLRHARRTSSTQGRFATPSPCSPRYFKPAASQHPCLYIPYKPQCRAGINLRSGVEWGPG